MMDSIYALFNFWLDFVKVLIFIYVFISTIIVMIILDTHN